MITSSTTNATAKKCAFASFCLIVLAAGWHDAAAQATLERPRDTGLKKNESPKVQKLPDLVVTGIEYSGTKAAITVHNKGIETSTPCKLKFDLAAGEAGEHWTVPIPALLPKGFVHTVTISRNQPFAGKGVAKVDPENQVTESNESNNTLTINQAAVAPDIAAIGISFKDEGGVTQVVGSVQNVSKVNAINSNIQVRLKRIALYGAHQNILEFKTQNIKNLGAGFSVDVKAPMPKPFPGADSYIWILRVDGDANDANNNFEKKSTKVDNN